MKHLSIIALMSLSLMNGAFAAGGKLGKKSGLPAPIERLMQVVDKLNLTDAQEAKISPIIDQAQADMMKLRTDAKSKGTKPAARQQLQSIRQRLIRDIAQQLTPEQKKEFQQQIKQLKN